jgi:hypothetical protein
MLPQVVAVDEKRDGERGVQLRPGISLWRYVAFHPFYSMRPTPPAMKHASIIIAKSAAEWERHDGRNEEAVDIKS